MEIMGIDIIELIKIGCTGFFLYLVYLIIGVFRGKPKVANKTIRNIYNNGSHKFKSGIIKAWINGDGLKE